MKKIKGKKKKNAVCKKSETNVYKPLTFITNAV